MTRPVTSVTFLGGTGTVTGSRFLVEAGDARVLVDCGLYQGPRELRQRNWDAFPVDPSSIDAVLVTHAHIDHCGYLPVLVRDGFRGAIHATTSTGALLEIVLPDSGRLHEEEAAHAARHHWSRHDPPLPLYTEEDALRALERVVPAGFGVPVDVADGVSAMFRPAGHILGSAAVEVRTPTATVVFSGDLGRDEHPLLAPPQPPPTADLLVVESTYGDRLHEDPAMLVDRLAEAVSNTMRRGGTVVVPAFAVDRTEIVLDALDGLTASGALPRVPVFVDSPMALATLEVYRRAIAAGAADLRPDLDGWTLEHLDLRPARTVEESKAIDAGSYPAIVVSASGMAAGGRVLHHLARWLPDPRATVLIVGFQAAGTRGRQLQDGARSVKLLGGYVPVRAQVVDVSGMSAHADRDELLRWVDASSEPPTTVFVVHGEPAASSSLADRIGSKLDLTAVAPEAGERVLVVRAR